MQIACALSEPNVLLVGDSITRAYFPGVVKLLAGKANLYLFATSCSAGDPRLADQLHGYFKTHSVSFALIHFNNGMHGWTYADSDYVADLPDMVKTLRDEHPESRLIWVTTTPVLENTDGATSQRIDLRNDGSLAVMKNADIPVDDQHLLMSAHNDLHSDGIHFNPAGNQIQAQQAVASILPLLPTQSTTPVH